MKKITIALLTFVVLFMILSAGALLYVYSSAGNARIQSYLEKKIQEETGLPVVFDRFRLQKGHLYFIAILDKGASLGFDGGFDLFNRSIDGKYLLKADNFKYKKYTLRQANISGSVSGTIHDLHIEGKGTLLNEPAAFKLKIKNKTPQDIIVQLRKLPLDEILALAGMPRIAHGKVNADIIMPSIGNDNSKGNVVVQLSDGRFDPVLLRKLYNYTMPPDKVSLKGEFKASIDGDSGNFSGSIESDLLSARIEHGQISIVDKALASDFSLDAKELAPVSQSRLRGPMKLSGTVKYDTLGWRVHAKTSSLGGDININYSKNLSAKLSNVSLSKILHLIAQPDYAEGSIDGRVLLDGAVIPNGSYGLKLRNGKFHSKVINRSFGTHLPKDSVFTVDSDGRITHGTLNGTGEIKSNLFSATVLGTHYNMITGSFDTKYKIYIPNPLLLAGKSGKGVPVTVSGAVSKNKSLRISGITKGLGKKLTFDYNDNRLLVAGDDVSVDRLLASAGQSVAVSGLADIAVNFSSLNPLSGDIFISAPRLQTNPAVVKKITGKPIDTTLALSVKGTAGGGNLHGQADIKSPLMDLSMPKISFSAKTSRFAAPYHLHITSLAKVAPIIGMKLQGAFASDGELVKDQHLSISGSSTSLGGTLDYKYLDSQAFLKLSAVPLSNLLHMLRQPEQLMGLTDATLRYNVLSKVGQAHATIEKFQFKPGKMTTAVKMLLQKDLSQIIYDHTTVDAMLNGEKIRYKISARGRRSDFVINDGLFDIKTKNNKGSFGLRIDNLDVIGTIKGPVKRPRISVLPGRMLRNRLKKRVVGKVKKEITGKMGNKVDKILQKIPLF